MRIHYFVLLFDMMWLLVVSFGIKGSLIENFSRVYQSVEEISNHCETNNRDESKERCLEHQETQRMKCLCD